MFKWIQNKFNINQNYLLLILNYIVTNNRQKLYIAESQRGHYLLEVSRRLYFSVVFSFIAISFGLVVIGDADAIRFKAIITILETLTFFALIIDYILLAMTFRVRSNGKYLSTLLYPFTILGLITLLSLFPSFWVINNFLPERVQILEVLRSFVFLRVGRILIILSAFKPFEVLIRALKSQRKILFNVFLFAVVLILLFAAIIYNIERRAQPEKFANYLDAIYFTTITLTTIGFGDIAPVTQLGKVIIIILALSGIALIAIPSGIIAGAFLSELKNKNLQKKVNRSSLSKWVEHKEKIYPLFFYKRKNDFFKIAKYRHAYDNYYFKDKKAHSKIKKGSSEAKASKEKKKKFKK